MDTNTSELTNDSRSWISEDKDWIKADNIGFIYKLTIDEMLRTLAEMGYLIGDEDLMMPYSFFKQLKTHLRYNFPDLDVDHITIGELMGLNLLESNEEV